MSRVLVVLGIAVFSIVGMAQAAESNAAAVYKVGLAYRSFEVSKSYDWRGAKTHALSVTIWYPLC